MADKATFNIKSVLQNLFLAVLYSSQFSAFTSAESFTIQEK